MGSEKNERTLQPYNPTFRGLYHIAEYYWILVVTAYCGDKYSWQTLYITIQAELS